MATDVSVVADMSAPRFGDSARPDPLACVSRLSRPWSAPSVRVVRTAHPLPPMSNLQPLRGASCPRAAPPPFARRRYCVRLPWNRLSADSREDGASRPPRRQRGGDGPVVASCRSIAVTHRDSRFGGIVQLSAAAGGASRCTSRRGRLALALERGAADDPGCYGDPHHYASQHGLESTEPPAWFGAGFRACLKLRSGYAIRSASCVRDFTSSLRNALRRWYSTVLGLMNS